MSGTPTQIVRDALTQHTSLAGAAADAAAEAIIAELGEARVEHRPVRVCEGKDDFAWEPMDLGLAHDVQMAFQRSPVLHGEVRIERRIVLAAPWRVVSRA